MSLPAVLPTWATRLRSLYESHAANQFLLFGNVNDRFLIDGKTLGTLHGSSRASSFPASTSSSATTWQRRAHRKGRRDRHEVAGLQRESRAPARPRQATGGSRVTSASANLARLGQDSHQIGFLMKAAHLVAPALPGALNYDLSALALLMRDWAADDALTRHALATLLIAENLNDMHPLLVNHPRASAIEVPLPATAELRDALAFLSDHTATLAEFAPVRRRRAATGTTHLGRKSPSRQNAREGSAVREGPRRCARSSSGLRGLISSSSQSARLPPTGTSSKHCARTSVMNTSPQ
jgi:hypothetical protein